ncbi:hypothetical protein GCM10023238_34570 [Streptomyces heliomycini]
MLEPAAFAQRRLPVHDDADVLGHLSGVQVTFHPACVQPDQQAAQLVAQVHVIVSPSVRIGQARTRPAASRGGAARSRPRAAPVRMAVPEGEAYPCRGGGSPKAGVVALAVRPAAARGPSPVWPPYVLRAAHVHGDRMRCAHRSRTVAPWGARPGAKKKTGRSVGGRRTGPRGVSTITLRK